MRQACNGDFDEQSRAMEMRMPIRMEFGVGPFSLNPVGPWIDERKSKKGTLRTGTAYDDSRICSISDGWLGILCCFYT